MVDFRGGNQFQKMMVTKDKRPLLEAQIEESFKKKFIEKNGFQVEKYEKKLKVQKWCQNGSTSLFKEL